MCTDAEPVKVYKTYGNRSIICQVRNNLQLKNIINFKDQIELQLSWVVIADKDSAALASEQIVTFNHIAYPLSKP